MKDLKPSLRFAQLCLLAGICGVSLSTPALAQAAGSKNFADYVNPLIGTAGMGHTFPGACAPFGAVQLSPETDTIPHNVDGRYQAKAYDYCAGYQYDDPTIVGFSHTHLSGTGHSDLGDLLIMPQTGRLQLRPGTAEHPEDGYRSRFSHDDEVAQAGYYRVRLSDNDVVAELTATPRVGVHRYTFPEGQNVRLILDMVHGIYGYDGKVLWSSLRVENDTLLTGYRITNGWARCNYTYFAISLSRPIQDYGYAERRQPKYQGFWRKFQVHRNFPEIGGRDVTAYLNFASATKDARQLVVKVALSGVSTEGALKNLRAEAEGKSFDQLRAETVAQWNRELGVLRAEGTEQQKTMLYTSLYHTMINPSVYMDVDRRYRGLDGNIHVAEGFDNYTVFSVWDTYRAEHPLLSLIKPQRNRDMVCSMLAHQRQSIHHMLPVWSLMGNEGWCMTGYHAVTVVADALRKGADVPADEALQAMVQTANCPYYESIEDYIRLGYAPFDRSATAASNTLEYAFDDWTIYAAAQQMGHNDVAETFARRALNYRNTFHPQLGFACPRYSNGEFKKDLDPYQTYGEGFIEGNSWNFSFQAPHDVQGLMRVMGGEQAFMEKLDKLFEMNLPERYYADNEDITAECLVGGYVHGNEPSHHIPYLYAWTSAPWKTQQWLRTIINQMYRPEIRGLGGNDDCGQMSAWYVFSVMGFYPVCPGSNQYVLGAPYLPYLCVTLPNGRTIEIKAPGVSDKNRYVLSVKLNGQPYSRLYLTHDDLASGCTIEFVMGSKPNKKRGLSAEDKPYSMTDGPDAPQARPWSDYAIPKIHFEDKAEGTEGSRLYHSIIPQPEAYINSVAREVLQTLYASPTDSIVPLHRLHYTLEDKDGISAKDGGGGKVNIFYSTRHVARSFAGGDTAAVKFETRGVLLHELTHAYQLEPQGIGNYGNNRTFWAFIEGMADAVRVANGGFHGEKDRPKRGSYKDGYRTAGYFFVWIRDNKDPDFLRKFNRSTLAVVPWSWDGAIQYALGPDYTIDALWQEYQVAVGDAK